MYIGKERKKDGGTQYYFNKDADTKTAEVVLLCTCEHCVDIMNKQRLYSMVRIDDLGKASKKMKECPFQKKGRVANGSLFGIYKNQSKISVGISHLESMKQLYNHQR